MFGDFNTHSNNDTPRQEIDTFEDINYDQVVNLLQKEGNYSRIMVPQQQALSLYVNEYAKEYGIDTIYIYNFVFDNTQDGSAFIHMT
ncbi:MAG: hypothetical protein E7234_14280 [Lachnospiraceae bacterium]|jgi:hypothetical protein|nr:hypothetical protein [Lachnospiraceae bacterium]